MNILSTISTIIYTSFFIGAGYMLTIERKSVLNIFAAAVLSSLGWWSFCNSFFFSATTKETAWFWHKLSSIGWCGFVAFTAYYFIALTNFNKKIMACWKQILFFLPPTILICKNLFGKTTSLAQNIIMSSDGLALTYENSITSFWLWVYLIYVFAYFGFGFYLLYKWARTVKHKMKKEMAIGFIILDVTTILFGLVTDVVFPITNYCIPALASIGTILFAIGYFGIINNYDLFNINFVISSDTILETSNNPFFVIDENKEILKCNNASSILIGYSKKELTGINFENLLEDQIDFKELCSSNDLKYAISKIRCNDGDTKDILISASIAKDKKHSFLCIIVSCQDVSRQKKMQDELELQKENYEKLAVDYHKLAYFDPLTDLPNRRNFFDTLNSFVELYKVENKDFAIFFMDLDNFKYANDIYGHEFGDQLLKVTSDKLKSCVENGEFVSRLGGDEFTIIMPIEGKSVGCKMQKICDEFQKSTLVDGRLYEVKISVGYSVFSEVCDITELMQVADEKMYKNKRKNKQLEP